jgi:hypothetical protein
MTRLFSFTLLSSLLVLAGCGGNTTNTDAGGIGDAGSDGGAVDGGAVDGGAVDGGSDAGAVDSGVLDAGDLDAGPGNRDAGTDAAMANDAGASGPAASCVASGGTVGMQLCCGATPDFPNTCSIGACGCAPSSSHQVSVCNCPSGTCFDGTACH